MPIWRVHGYFFCFSHCSYVQYLWGYKCVARYGTSNECCLRLWVSVFIVWHLTACLITVSMRKVFHLLHIRIRWIGWAIFLYFLFMPFFRLCSYVHIYLLSAHIFWSLKKSHFMWLCTIPKMNWKFHTHCPYTTLQQTELCLIICARDTSTYVQYQFL